MKRGNVSSHEKSMRKDPVVIRIRTEGRESEPMRIVGKYDIPNVGEIFQAVPTRFRKNLFAKTFVLQSVGEEDGIAIYYCDFGVL